jgi:hypothetical protein
MLSNVAIWGNIDFERDVLESGKIQRNMGLFFVIVSFIVLGSALFSTLLHVQNNRIIWLLGVTIFSSGIDIAKEAFDPDTKLVFEPSCVKTVATDSDTDA